MKNFKIIFIIFIAVSLLLTGCFLNKLTDGLVPNKDDNASISENNNIDNGGAGGNEVTGGTGNGGTSSADIDRIIASGDYVKQEILVKMTLSTSPEQIAEIVNGEILEISPEIFVVRIQIPEDLDIKEAINVLNRSKLVQYAEPNGLRFMHETITPNDPSYQKRQWAPQLTGLEEVWGITKGEGIVIAITDTGVDGTHPDFEDKVLAGYDTFNNTEIFAQTDSDVYGHGTHCAGIAAAVGNNNIGMAGVAWDAEILPVKMSQDDWPYRATSFNMAKAYIWAADNGAHIISCSFGGKGYSQTEKDAVDYALGKGCAFFASMGNSSISEIMYPAGYQGVIAVGATDAHDRIASFSTTGSHMSVCAPGVEIYSTMPGNSYDYLDGTSMSCPFVAGVAALMLSNDSLLTPYDIKTRLEKSAVPIDGGCRVDAYNAINDSSPNIYGSIKVKVTDKMDVPLSGASIILWQDGKTVSTTNSNDNGEAIFEFIPAGEYGVSASLPCFSPSPAADNPVTVAAGEQAVEVPVKFLEAIDETIDIRAKMTDVSGISITWKMDENSSSGSNDILTKILEDKLIKLGERDIPKEIANYRDLSVILSPKGSNNIEYFAEIDWHTYQDAKGYLVYKRIGLEFIEIYKWERPYDHYGDEWLGYLDRTSSLYTCEYYVIAYGDCWETEPSDIVTINTWLPSCSLVSPQDGAIVTDPTPTFTWNPVGISAPYGSIEHLESDLWVYDLTLDLPFCWYGFGDATTSTQVYNPSGGAASPVSGHEYVWNSWAYGYDENWNLIAVSWTEDWEFTYEGEQALTPGGLAYNWYNWPYSSKGFNEFDVDLTIDIDPGAQSAYYWAHQFPFKDGDGGYMGLQTNGYISGLGWVGKMAIFSIWDALDAKAGPGAYCEEFGGEGEGWSCRKQFNWVEGHTYGLRVKFEESDGQQNKWWGAYIIDKTVSEDTFLGKILVPSDWKGLGDWGWSVVWVEYYGKVAGCSAIPHAKARFEQPMADNEHAPENIEPEYGERCANSSITIIGKTGVIFETGKP